MLKLHLKDQDQTKRLGKILAKLLAPGDCILFMGDLGAGKTFLIREIARHLGIDTRLVTSPTFSIVHTYPHPGMAVVHADLYRLGAGADLEETGLLEHLLDEKACGLIEWGDFLSQENRQGLHILEVRLYFPEHQGADSCERLVAVSTSDKTWRDRLEQLKKMTNQEDITCESTGS